MTIGILKENGSEQRVSLAPDALPTLQKLGFENIIVEKGAGEAAFFNDEAYQKNGARIADTATVMQESDLLVRVQPLSEAQIGQLAPGKIIVGQFNPLNQTEQIAWLQRAGITAFSLDLAPRSTRAQALDVLSSMALAAGYKAVLLAATHLPNFLPMFMTAAGTIRPGKVLVLGAGVAGLQAIATARRLGAVVEAFDVRTAAKEEVLSLGAKFVEVEGAAESAAAGGYAIEQSDDFKARQAKLIHDHAVQADAVICTAQIPGRRAPILLRADTVRQMKPGAVIVDLAASTGGNCELTENGQTKQIQQVTIIGDSNLPSTLPRDASSLFGKNVLNFLKLIVNKGVLSPNFQDEIVSATCIAHQGEVVSERLKKLLSNA